MSQYASLFSPSSQPREEQSIPRRSSNSSESGASGKESMDFRSEENDDVLHPTTRYESGVGVSLDLSSNYSSKELP